MYIDHTFSKKPRPSIFEPYYRSRLRADHATRRRHRLSLHGHTLRSLCVILNPTPMVRFSKPATGTSTQMDTSRFSVLLLCCVNRKQHYDTFNCKTTRDLSTCLILGPPQVMQYSRINNFEWPRASPAPQEDRTFELNCNYCTDKLQRTLMVASTEPLTNFSGPFRNETDCWIESKVHEI